MKLPRLAYLAAVLWVAAQASAQAPPAAPSRPAQGAEAAPLRPAQGAEAAEDAYVWIGRLASEDTRDQARDKLRDLGAAAVEALVKSLKHEDAIIRSESAFVLGRLGRKDAVPPLIDVLGDIDPRARANAAYALGEISDARAVDPLVKALSDADALVRANVCFALGHVGDPRAAPDLVKALVDPDENVRNFAASALGTTKEPKALPALAWSALNDPSDGVRALASTSMGMLKDRRVCATLVTLLNDRAYVVRARAIDALFALANERRDYDPRAGDAARAGAVGRWKSWLARQKLAPVEAKPPAELYADWPGRPKPQPLDEPPADAPEIDLIPAAPAAKVDLPADPDEAERVYRQALAANPDSALARFNLAELLLKRGKAAEPLRLCEALNRMAALPEGMDRALIQLRLGTCYRRYGNRDRATALLDEAAEGTANAARVREAARQFAAMKDFKRARALLERSYNLAGGDAESAWALGSYLLHVPDDAVRDPAKAKVYAEVAFTAKPDDERFASLMAEIEKAQKSLAPNGEKAE